MHRALTVLDRHRDDDAVPTPAAASIASAARSPNVAASRRRTMSSPKPVPRRRDIRIARVASRRRPRARRRATPRSRWPAVEPRRDAVPHGVLDERLQDQRRHRHRSPRRRRPPRRTVEPIAEPHLLDAQILLGQRHFARQRNPRSPPSVRLSRRKSASSWHISARLVAVRRESGRRSSSGC